MKRMSRRILSTTMFLALLAGPTYAGLAYPVPLVRPGSSFTTVTDESTTQALSFTQILEIVFTMYWPG